MTENQNLTPVRGSAPHTMPLVLPLKNGKKITLNIPVKHGRLSKDNPSDVDKAHEFTSSYRQALLDHTMRVFDIGVRTIEAVLTDVPGALGYSRIEDWAWDEFHIKRRTMFYYKYAGAIYFRLLEVMPEIFKETISHTKLIIVGDHILSSTDPEEIKEYVHDTIALSIPELQKVYHPKPSDHNLKFWFTGTLKNVRAQYHEIAFKWETTPHEISSDSYFATWAGRKLRVYMEEVK